MRVSSRQLAAFSRRQWLVASGGAFGTALLTGLPTDVVPNPFYTRMTPVLWWNYPVWVLTALLAGLVLATYVRRVPVGSSAGASVGGGLMSFFAVGCPICNKLVVMAIGVSGALNLFAPIQPVLAVGSILLLTYALWARRRTAIACRVRVGVEP